MTLNVIAPRKRTAFDNFLRFINEKAQKTDNEDGQVSLTVKSEDHKRYKDLEKKFITLQLSEKILPESLFVSLISHFDAYLNQLLRILFEIRPEYINDSSRNLTFNDLSKFDSIDQARNHVIEREIESILRKSHSEHFKYMEFKLDIKLGTHLPIWSQFIEITERRNLFVHCDGLVSNQYITVCHQNNADLTDVKPNQKLSISQDYFQSSYECLIELAVKLTHTIWRKLLAHELDAADDHLSDICYSLLVNQQFNLADNLLDFACRQKKFYDERSKNVFIVNRALSMYLQNRTPEANEIIDQKDWSALSNEFKLAYFVLKEDYDECVKLMRKIGNKGEVKQEHYRSWPLFTRIREEQLFIDAYQEIFKEQYRVAETPKQPIEGIIDKNNKNTPKYEIKKTQNDENTSRKKLGKTKKKK